MCAEQDLDDRRYDINAKVPEVQEIILQGLQQGWLPLHRSCVPQAWSQLEQQRPTDTLASIGQSGRTARSVQQAVQVVQVCDKPDDGDGVDGGQFR